MTSGEFHDTARAWQEIDQLLQTIVKQFSLALAGVAGCSRTSQLPRNVCMCMHMRTYMCAYVCAYVHTDTYVRNSCGKLVELGKRGYLPFFTA